VAPPEVGEASPLWVDVQKLCNMCVLSLSWNFFVSHRTKPYTFPMHCSKCVSLWGTSYSRPPIDPYLTSPLLQNPGGSTGSPLCPAFAKVGDDLMHLVPTIPKVVWDTSRGSLVVVVPMCVLQYSLSRQHGMFVQTVR